MTTSDLPLIDAFDVIWTTPSKDAAGSMPIGNGEVVLNVWVEDRTGDLLFYIGRTDSLSEICRMLKLGRIRVHCNPSPFKNASDFRQHLSLHDGRIAISGGGAKLEVFVDSSSNSIHVSGTSRNPFGVTATLECWRNASRQLPPEEKQSAWSVHDAPFPLIESPDVVLPNRTADVTWYHRNETSIVPQVLANQSLTGASGTFDPLLHRTFGGRIFGKGFAAIDSHSISLPNPRKEFDLTVSTVTSQTKTVGDWLAELDRQPNPNASKTKNWWHSFWSRCWVLADGQPEVTRGYLLQRFVQACQGRGEYPIKFNGGTYTVEPLASGRPFNADWRNWGDCHWFQNVRHMYHPMMESGDFDMMDPFFRLYESARTLAESRTVKYHGAKGAYFPETMTVFGTYSGGDYGWDRTGKQPKDVDCQYWQFAWNQGPELIGLMLDYWDYTRNEQFLKSRLLPMATSVLKYFDTRFPKDEHGKIRLTPTQVVETYWHGVVNDMPTVSGLISITNRLSSLPEKLVSADQRLLFEKMKSSCPELPLQWKDGLRQLAPAQEYMPDTSNVENGQLYAVWPARIVSLAHPEYLKEAKTAYANRLNHLDTGWGYDGNVAALLGMTDEASRILKVKCANSNPSYRWPATWGPNYDWLPDQNHGGNLLTTTELMLLQSEPLESGGAIRLLPAWPRGWDVDFQLHAPGNTVVRCVLQSGRIERLDVSPEARRKDVLMPPWVH